MTDHRHLTGLLGLPKMGPRRLAALLRSHGGAEAAWRSLARNETQADDLTMSPDTRAVVLPRWHTVAAATDLDALWARHRTLGIDIIGPDHPDWPPALVDDPEPPPLLFCRGDRSPLHRTAVAIVGTRRCTALGRAVARELGHDLAAAGVIVISGLALGIDGEAHRGVLAAGGAPLGVVATGLDVVYPGRHRDLWERVGAFGLLTSEVPAGTAPERWRFPARNRIMAGLAEVVVVVESPRTGGSMRTVDSAEQRGTPVMAVPGPVRSPASDGPNQLLVDGCAVVRDATDVLVALGSRAPGPAAGARTTWRPDPHAADAVARAISWPPITLEQLGAVTGLPFDALAARLAELELAGVVEQVAAGYQRRAI